MKLTVLGEFGPYPPAGGACSGYLVSEGDFHVLMDCGPGVLARLQQVIAIEELSAVVLSHLHSDHMADLSVLRYALAALKRQGRSPKVPLPVYCPPEPAPEAGFLQGQAEYAVTLIADGMTLPLGPLTFSFTDMTHPVPSFAITAQAGGRRLVYSGDTRMNGRIGPLAAGADLFLCEAGSLQADLRDTTPHLSVREAAGLGREGLCGQTLLTHLAPFYDRRLIEEEAARAHPGARVVRAMDVYEP